MSSDTEFSSNAHASVPPESSDTVQESTVEYEIPTRHPDLSFADGNVVVLTGHQYFVVHQAVLSRHSAVLKKYLAFLPKTCTRLLEDRPVLQLSNTPEDMYHFLRALYGMSTYNDVAQFHIAAAVLRLSMAYEVEALRSDVLRRLMLAWPRTLSQWEVREQSSTNAEGLYAPRTMLPHPILVISLARELHVSDLLPSAFYDISRYLPSAIASGYTDPSLSRTHYLSSDDLFKVFRGKEQAARYFSTFIVKELEGRSPSEFCQNRHELQPARKRRCQIAYEAVTYALIQDVSGLVVNRNSDPLFAIMDSLLMQTKDDAPGLDNKSTMRACEACRMDYAAVVDNVRQELWRRLPEWFELDVPDWA